MRRRRSYPASRHRGGTTMSLGESPPTIGHNQACSSLPGASAVRAAAFARDPSLEIVRASHVEEYGERRRAPADAVVEFQGDDPEAGPLLRYTIVTPQDQQLRQKICGRCGGGWGAVPATPVSDPTSTPVLTCTTR